jgi:hypothetical protein
MNQDATRYPLAWPTGWKRTSSRRRATFHRQVRAVDPTNGTITRNAARRALTLADACERLSAELRRLGATHEVLSTNLSVRLDGRPRSGQPEPTDPGAAVYFRLRGQDRCLACDTWTRTADNVAAVAGHIAAIRTVERYGVGTIDQAFSGYAALPPAPAPHEWWRPLQVSPNATLEQVEEAFHRLARTHHPDVGGQQDLMQALTLAREQARQALGAR